MTKTPTPTGTQHTTARRPSKVACWVEAMRLRTLPVSVSGVLMGASLAIIDGSFRWLPTTVCLLFAILAQVASNFANEYFDYRDGLDKKGRTGPRRGVTEGDITPQAMLRATFVTLALAAACGCTLLQWGGWWLIPIGIAIVLGALAYSAGPYPLSRHGWGEVAVVAFFGIAPVTLTYYLQTGHCTTSVWLTAVATGLMGANVLIVNNYRDRREDAAVGKRTLAVRFGAKFTSWLYLANGIAVVALTLHVYARMPDAIFAPGIYLYLTYSRWEQLRKLQGSKLNPLLGQTAMTMLIYTLITLLSAIFAA